MSITPKFVGEKETSLPVKNDLENWSIQSNGLITVQS